MVLRTTTDHVLALIAVLAFIVGLICSLRTLRTSSQKGRAGLVALACFQLTAALFVGRVIMLAMH